MAAIAYPAWWVALILPYGVHAQAVEHGSVIGGIMLNRITDKWVYLLFAVLWITVIAVADMNWPTHMGDRGVLLEVLNIL